MGGDDFDHALADWAAAQAGVQIHSAHDKRTLLLAARAAKEGLTEADSVTLTATLAAGDIAVEVTRSQFDGLTRPLLDRTLSAVRKVLRDAKVTRDEVQGEW